MLPLRSALAGHASAAVRSLVRGSEPCMRTFSSSSAVASSSAASDKAARFVIPIAKDALPRGFAVSATYGGVKAAISPKLTAPSSSSAPPLDPKPDVALIVSSVPASAAGTFTQNVFKAAPVVYSSEVLTDPGNKGKVRSILVNSGCANAVTGQQGYDDAKACAAMVQKHLAPAPGLKSSSAADSSATLVLSTGVIGVPLPMQVFKKTLPFLTSGQILRNDTEAWHQVARAFMTTDTFPKLRTRSFTLAGLPCKMVGIDKGAGMIHPHMSGPAQTLHATLLGLIATDAPIEPASLQQALEHAVARSFNCISVDGDMSTNDTILALANGQALNASTASSELQPGQEISAASHPEAFAHFQRELTAFCTELSQLIVRDGEGATKFVAINVRGAPTHEHAHAIASSISTSALVKCALHGADANWGRVLCAVGYAKLPPFTGASSQPATGAKAWAIDPARVTVSFELPETLSQAEADKAGVRPMTVLKDGVPQKVDEDAAARLLGFEDISIVVDLQGGSAGPGAATEQATYWTCDFSKEYVAINGDYRS